MPIMAAAMWRIFWVVMLIIGALVLSMVLMTPGDIPRPEIERAECLYSIDGSAVVATPIPGCPTRLPPGS